MSTSFPAPESFPQYFNEDYDVVGVLGRGGMGYVYKAIHKNLNREVALKVLDASVGDESSNRFHLEAQAMKKLDHQNIVQVYDYGKEGGRHFIAMTYVAGQTLSEFLRTRKYMEAEESLLICRQICRALLYAHNRGVVHRDVKPSNVIVSPDNRVYLTDFGISQIQELDRLTSTGMAMGTPEYMSPEQCQGESVTKQSDIYGIGILLYEMLCGDPPFHGGKPLSIAWKQVHENVRPPRELRPEIPPALEDIILRCLQKDRSLRYGDVGQLLADLDCLENTTSESGGTAPFRLPPAASLLKKPPYQGYFPVRLLSLAIIIVSCISALLVALLLQTRSKTQFGFLRNLAIEAPHVKHALDHGASPQGYPPHLVFDGDLRTAWICPANLAQPVLSLRFPKPSLLMVLGIAIGYQKSADDEFQDRFAMFSRPQEILLRSREGQTRRIKLSNVRGVQYHQIQPLEVQDLQLEILSQFQPVANAPAAISELRLLGIPLPAPSK